MYRYFLFYYDHYYPCGGMNDCVFKTDDFDDLEQFIHANYEDDYLYGTISYYDVLEDKTMYAVMDEYTNEYHLIRFRFAGWEEDEDE
jgi:hypothetical protein